MIVDPEDPRGEKRAAALAAAAAENYERAHEHDWQVTATGHELAEHHRTAAEQAATATGRRHAAEEYLEHLDDQHRALALLEAETRARAASGATGRLPRPLILAALADLLEADGVQLRPREAAA